MERDAVITQSQFLIILQLQDTWQGTQKGKKEWGREGKGKEERERREKRVKGEMKGEGRKRWKERPIITQSRFLIVSQLLETCQSTQKGKKG